MTSDTSGLTSPTPLAFYDPESSCWRTSAGTFPWGSTESSLTLPAWGTTRAGVLYERPTPAHLTSGPGSSSSLPTPTARDGKAGMDYRQRTEGPDLYQVAALLPTPTAQDASGSRNNTAEVRPDSTGNVGDTLTDAAWLLDGIGGRIRGRSNAGNEPSDGEPLTLWSDDNFPLGSSSG